MPKYTVQEVTIEDVKKGKNSWQVASVVYTTPKGDNKTKKVVSFSNPGVFATVKDITSGTEIEVDFVPDDEYYNWAKVTKLSNAEPTSVPSKIAVVPQSRAATTTSTYETAEERKFKQLLIVRQSSISNAIEYQKIRGDELWNTDDVIETAKTFVDFVYGNDVKLIDMESDIPV